MSGYFCMVAGREAEGQTYLIDPRPKTFNLPLKRLFIVSPGTL